jgi:hypothetical protein
VADSSELDRLEDTRRQIEERQQDLDARWARYAAEPAPAAVWVRLQIDLDRLAGLRDRLARARDEAADARDVDAEQSLRSRGDAESPGAADAALASESLRAAGDREAARADRTEARLARERAASDRSQASADRERAFVAREEWAERLDTALGNLRELLRVHTTACEEAALAHRLSGALYEQLALTEERARRADDLLRAAETERDRAVAAEDRARRVQAALDESPGRRHRDLG